MVPEVFLSFLKIYRDMFRFQTRKEREICITTSVAFTFSEEFGLSATRLTPA
jgi:hypothetical protein